jgi:branched-chain amino acid transport system ATP-binding protein
MARAFQVARIFRDMTVGENINLALDSSRTWLSDGDVERQTPNVLNARAGYGVEEVLRDVGLTGFRNKSADTLSHGDQKRLELGLCIALQPKLLLLDEPTAGMSPDVRRETISLIRDLMKKYGLTVILTDHDMDVVFSLADNLTVLHQGAVLSTGDPGIVREDSVVKEIYLG